MASPEDEVLKEIGKGTVLTVAVAVGLYAYLRLSGLWSKGSKDKYMGEQPENIPSKQEDK